MIKLGLRYIISGSLLSKWIGMIYFGGFLFVYVVFHILFLKHLLLWYQAIFFGNCCFKFWAKSHDNFSSVFFKSLGNFWHSLLQYLKEKCFEKLRKVSISARRLWLVILDHLLVSTKRSPHCKKWRERFPYGTIVIHKFSCLI